MITKPGWLLDEVANAGRENLDPEHVSRYDLKEDAGTADEVRLLEELGLAGDSVVVKIGRHRAVCHGRGTSLLAGGGRGRIPYHAEPTSREGKESSVG